MLTQSLIQIWAAEYHVCKNCPLRYCILDRYAEGAECLYLYTASPEKVARLKLIEQHLDEPVRIDELSRLTNIHRAILQRLCQSDILIGDVVGGGTGRYLMVKAVNWPAGVSV